MKITILVMSCLERRISITVLECQLTAEKGYSMTHQNSKLVTDPF